MTVRNQKAKWTKRQFAETFGMSEKQVERYCQLGMPHEKEGTRVHIAMPEARVWFHEHLVEKGRRAAAPSTFDEARLRRESAAAEMEELKLERERRRSMKVTDTVRILVTVNGRVRAKLLNLAPRAAGAAFGALTIQEAQAKIEPIVYEIMEELANDAVPGELTDEGE